MSLFLSHEGEDNWDGQWRTVIHKGICIHLPPAPSAMLPHSQVPGDHLLPTNKNSLCSQESLVIREKFQDVLNVIRLERERNRTVSLLIAMGQLTRLLTFLSVCWKFELTSSWLFPDYLTGKIARQHRTPGASDSCLRMSFLDCFPHPTQRSRHFFLTNSAPIPKLALLPLLPLRVSIASANSFNQFTFFISLLDV